MSNAQIMPPNDFLDLNLPTGADEDDTPRSLPELSHSDSESTNESLGDDDDIDPYGVLTEYERDNNVRLRAKVFLWFQDGARPVELFLTLVGEDEPFILFDTAFNRKELRSKVPLSVGAALWRFLPDQQRWNKCSYRTPFPLPLGLNTAVVLATESAMRRVQWYHWKDRFCGEHEAITPDVWCSGVEAEPLPPPSEVICIFLGDAGYQAINLEVKLKLRSDGRLSLRDNSTRLRSLSWPAGTTLWRFVPPNVGLQRGQWIECSYDHSFPVDFSAGKCAIGFAVEGNTSDDYECWGESERDIFGDLEGSPDREDEARSRSSSLEMIQPTAEQRAIMEQKAQHRRAHLGASVSVAAPLPSLKRGSDQELENESKRVKM